MSGWSESGAHSRSSWPREPGGSHAPETQWRHTDLRPVQRGRAAGGSGNRPLWPTVILPTPGVAYRAWKRWEKAAVARARRHKETLRRSVDDTATRPGCPAGPGSGQPGPGNRVGAAPAACCGEDDVGGYGVGRQATSNRMGSREALRGATADAWSRAGRTLTAEPGSNYRKSNGPTSAVPMASQAGHAGRQGRAIRRPGKPV